MCFCLLCLPCGSKGNSLGVGSLSHGCALLCCEAPMQGGLFASSSYDLGAEDTFVRFVYCFLSTIYVAINWSVITSVSVATVVHIACLSLAVNSRAHGLSILD